MFPKQIFITGSDTGVGKTVVAAILAAGLGASYWKPIQCGLEGKSDSELVRELSGLPHNFVHPEAFRLHAPLSPHAAAALQGISIDLQTLSLPHTEPQRPLIVEGAGGVLVPINEVHFMVDLMRKLALPVLLVCRSTLGTINHTLLSLELLRRSHLQVVGVVMNGPLNEGNREAIEYYGKVKVVAQLPPCENLAAGMGRELYKKFFEGCQSESLSTRA